MSIKRTFSLMLLSKLMLINTIHSGFWILYESVWWNKPWYQVIVDAGVNVIIAPLCFFAWVLFEMWIRDPSTMPVFRTSPAAQTEEKEESLPV